MGLFGLILAMLVNFFLKSTGLDFAISSDWCADLRWAHCVGHAAHQGDVQRHG
jgi:hypothetical protein